MALLTALLAAALLQTGTAPEYQVKAVFLFNFAQFVDWPAPPPPVSDSGAPLVIGILGEDPFGSFLDATVRGERVRARPFALKRYQRVEDIDSCDILYISRSEAKRVPTILARLKDRPILTVSDVDRFAERGGMIRLVTDRGRIRLEVNLEAAQGARLTLSSKLLRVATIVTPRRL
jgi:hypothetical protein